MQLDQEVMIKYTVLYVKQNTQTTTFSLNKRMQHGWIKRSQLDRQLGGWQTDLTTEPCFIVRHWICMVKGEMAAILDQSHRSSASLAVLTMGPKWLLWSCIPVAHIMLWTCAAKNGTVHQLCILTCHLQNTNKFTGFHLHKCVILYGWNISKTIKIDLYF